MTLTLIIVGLTVGGLWLLQRRSLVSPLMARQQLADGGILVDVRSAEEFRGDHLPAAINLPLADLGAAAGQCLQVRDQPVLLYCLSGGRSAIARQRLKRLGYTRVFNLGSLARARKIVFSASKVPPAGS